MEQEQYVSFETAKLLREMGFTGECNADYRVHTNNDVEFETCDWSMSYNDGIPDNVYLAPTVDDAADFLEC